MRVLAAAIAAVTLAMPVMAQEAERESLMDMLARATQLNETEQRGALVGFVENQISSPDRQIRLNGIDGALPVTDVIDTIKRSTDGHTVGGTEDRTQLYAAQTPQGFLYPAILDAHNRAEQFSDSFTDDAAIAVSTGLSSSDTHAVYVYDSARLPPL